MVTAVFMVYVSLFCFVVGHFVQRNLPLEISWLSVMSVSLSLIIRLSFFKSNHTKRKTTIPPISVLITNSLTESADTVVL